MSKSEGRHEVRITDVDVVRKIFKLQRAEGDKKPTKTVAKIIDRYCESRAAQKRSASSGSLAVHSP